MTICNKDHLRQHVQRGHVFGVMQLRQLRVCQKCNSRRGSLCRRRFRRFDVCVAYEPIYRARLRDKVPALHPLETTLMPGCFGFQTSWTDAALAGIRAGTDEKCMHTWVCLVFVIIWLARSDGSSRGVVI